MLPTPAHGPSSNPTPTPTPSSGSAQSRETVRGLVGEFLDQKKLEIAEEAKRGGPSRVRAVLTALALTTCAMVWVLPSFFQAPVEAPSLMRVRASTRMTLFLAAERLRAYQQAHGSLPRTLRDAGVDSTGIVYLRATNTAFELSGTANGDTITFRSSMTNPAFLGNTLQVLSER
jgi:hypothetical protein